ncbi:XdhC family protein [Aquimarina sp. U1-2]|uniref:XdhC family protein n=1 Tax=Aquimarina sp. U1-2 TaxID=2823141 RepID=UPI001AECBEE0|nr:XdhC/CoxI family protein [Aquimarina sp. U1-2]MBP2832070.1 XdhC family protein [Aquimarina sp. U1-2]
MTHEFKEIIETYALVKQQKMNAVLATVVEIEGSSYRRPGVGMLLLEDGTTKGAVSGGCVEKEIFKQSQSVFKTGTSKIMTYDGKYRLGCEGVLYILIELLEMDSTATLRILEHIKNREVFEISSVYTKTQGEHHHIGSSVQFLNEEDIKLSKRSNMLPNSSLALKRFVSKMLPCFRLIIIGAEHDAVTLCKLASVTGWLVEVICSPNNPKQLGDFPGVSHIHADAPENLLIENVDNQTAFVVMTHNFAKDLLYLRSLTDLRPAYIGLLGPARRREKLLEALIEFNPNVSNAFLDIIHGPAGLNLGAETPEEIAISIISEILAVTREQLPISLQEKSGAIHDTSERKSIRHPAEN